MSAVKRYRDVNYMGFGLRLDEARSLARKIAEEPYAFDADGKEEFERDLKSLKEQMDAVYSAYISLKDVFGRD